MGGVVIYRYVGELVEVELPACHEHRVGRDEVDCMAVQLCRCDGNDRSRILRSYVPAWPGSVSRLKRNVRAVLVEGMATAYDGRSGT